MIEDGFMLGGAYWGGAVMEGTQNDQSREEKEVNFKMGK
jgi:hypothetical protein